MKKRKIYSPYYDFKTFQYNNPYQTSPTAGRPKKVATAEDKVASHGSSSDGKRSSSHENLETRRDAQGSGDSQPKKLQHANDAVGDHKPVSMKSCQTSPPLRRSPKRVPSQSFFSLNQQLLCKKSVPSVFYVFHEFYNLSIALGLAKVRTHFATCWSCLTTLSMQPLSMKSTPWRRRKRLSSRNWACRTSRFSKFSKTRETATKHSQKSCKPEFSVIFDPLCGNFSTTFRLDRFKL